jgi:hypothetical protein
MPEKSAAKEAALALLDGLAKKGLDDVKDENVRSYLKECWGEIHDQMPEIFEVLAGDGEVILRGKHLDASKEVLAKMEKDLLMFKDKEIDRIDFEELLKIRKATLYSLYNAARIQQAQPSVQKILLAAERVVSILLTKAVPYILMAL